MGSHLLSDLSSLVGLGKAVDSHLVQLFYCCVCRRDNFQASYTVIGLVCSQWYININILKLGFSKRKYFIEQLTGKKAKSWEWGELKYVSLISWWVGDLHKRSGMMKGEFILFFFQV